MRDIRFRGKRTQDAKWTYGRGVIIEKQGTAWISQHFHRGEWEQVDQDTASQNTELPDKEGSLIFDGDILDGSYINSPRMKQRKH